MKFQYGGKDENYVTEIMKGFSDDLTEYREYLGNLKNLYSFYASLPNSNAELEDLRTRISEVEKVIVETQEISKSFFESAIVSGYTIHPDPLSNQ